MLQISLILDAVSLLMISPPCLSAAISEFSDAPRVISADGFRLECINSIMQRKGS